MSNEERKQSLDEVVIQQVNDLLQHHGTSEMSLVFETLLEFYNDVNIQQQSIKCWYKVLKCFYL